ncbi:MAG TPA: hypothetical protein VJ741_07785 [Solirubrobacteraceae bacterium]|nr:hypothetical protein [Solirubrobacteraceae bacterium]
MSNAAVTTRTLKGALAGGVAAVAWASQQPLDKLIFRCRYDDVELLGRAVRPGGPGWYRIGLVIHAQNGALFGALYANIAPGLPVPPALRGPAAGLAEMFATWPLAGLSDRFHPARHQLPVLSGNRRAFAQAFWRHLLFGYLLGELEARLNASDGVPPGPPPDYASNGHGSLERAVSAVRD